MMKQHTPPWDLFGTFLAVMRDGSLSSAARALRVAQPTVRRQIEDLEAALGIVLFTRSQAGLRPTAAATDLLPFAQTMAATVAAGIRSASGAGKSDHGTVRLTCSEVVGVEILPPLLASFQRDHPGIDIELVPTNTTEDLVRRDADIAIRMTRPRQSGLVAKRIADVEIGLFAHSDYLARYPAPATISQLALGHSLIGEDQGRSIIEALAASGVELERSDFCFRADSDLAQLAALRAGLGIGICQARIAERDDSLRRVLPALGINLEVWIVMHEDLKCVPRVRTLFDMLAETLALRYRSIEPSQIQFAAMDNLN